MTLVPRLRPAGARVRRWLLRGRRLPVLLGLLLTWLAVLLFTTSLQGISGLRERLDNMVYDQRFALVPLDSIEPEHNIVIVDIDQKSLEREGQWPWSRFTLGTLVTNLAAHGALVVGFDAFFPEFERNLASELEQRLRATQALTDDAADLLRQMRAYADVMDADRYFADSMAAVDVVLGFSMLDDVSTQSGTLPEPMFRIPESEVARLALRNMDGFVGNVDTLQTAAAGAGFFDTVPDVDGVLRRTPLVMHHDEGIYPSLALEMARLFLFEGDFSLATESDATGNFHELQGIRMGGIHIPTDRRGSVLVPFAGPAGSYPYLSASDVIRDALTPAQKDLLQNSLVLVGTTATGLYDLRATPVQPVFPGVEIHANVLNAILQSSPSSLVETGESGANVLFRNTPPGGGHSAFPSRPDWEEGAVLLTIVLLGAAMALLFPGLGPAMQLMLGFSCMAALLVVNAQLWQRFGLDISVVVLLLLVLLVMIVNLGYGFLREGVQRRAIKGMFDQYVPPAHIDAMLDNPDSYNFDGESREMSVLFSDIRNFTSISESLSAGDLKRLLNEFFTPITGVIFAHQGTIDKYVGDMVMAFWGAPLNDADHRAHAVTAALQMIVKVEALKPLFRAQGLPEVDVGIGINTGIMNVGDMGSTYRRAYTVLGDAVNLGSRLESLTKVYGVDILIGEDTYAGLHDIVCREVDKVQVKGRDEPVRIFQPLCEAANAPADLLDRLQVYNDALAAYQHQQWDLAERGFLALQQHNPAEKLYVLYLQRISDLRTQALPANWDGTFRHAHK